METRLLQASLPQQPDGTLPRSLSELSPAHMVCSSAGHCQVWLATLLQKEWVFEFCLWVGEAHSTGCDFSNCRKTFRG